MPVVCVNALNNTSNSKTTETKGTNKMGADGETKKTNADFLRYCLKRCWMAEGASEEQGLRVHRCGQNDGAERGQPHQNAPRGNPMGARAFDQPA